MRIKQYGVLWMILMILGVFSTKAQTPQQNTTVHAWKGSLGQKISVFLDYRKIDSLYVGEVTYLNTEKQKSIPLIGTKYGQDQISLKEFNKDGLVTGIWIVKPQQDSLLGTWYMPGGGKQYAIQMTKKDTLLPAASVQKQPQQTEGDYFYQYGEKGPQGEFKIRKIGKDSILINAFSVTSAPARNIAEIEDTVALSGDHFIYKVNMNGDWMDKPCKIVMKGQFYADFLHLIYINEDPCRFYFGHNATLEGIYYKTEHKRK